ncbi:MAG: ABC transporter permease [Acidobacteria bacterium]|nr:ABC transporter permease [Acidobacteriota bacterium]
MGSFEQDLRYALRELRRNPGFTATVVAMLALGIAANTAVFSLIEAAMLRALPYASPNRLALVADGEDPKNAGFLRKDINPLRSENRSFSDIAFYFRDSGLSTVTLTIGTEPESVQGAFVSSNLFSLLGVPPALGRVFTSDEESRRNRVAVLSHGLWVRRFGSSPQAVGARMHIDGESFQVIGVMPRFFQFPARDQQFWAPITANRYWNDPSSARIDPNHSRYAYERWQAVGRLAKGVSLDRAQAQMAQVFSRLSQSDPDPNRGAAIAVRPLEVEMAGNDRRALLVLFVAVFFVLLISSGNVANLMLARAAVREREIALRTALGAGRGRLARQVLTESALIASISGIAGVVLASLGLRYLIALTPAGIPRMDEAGLNAGVLAFAAAASLLSTLTFGCAPAWKFSRANPSRSLSSGTPRAPLGMRTRSALVITEFALALVLLASTGLLIRSFLRARSVDPGFEPRRALVMRASVARASTEPRNVFYDAVLERARALPGVESAGEVDALFELGEVRNLGLRAIDGRAPEPGERWTPLSWVAVRGDYFQAMGTPLLKGRYFGPEDGPRSSLVAIIDESMAKRYWANEDPIGKRFKGQDRRGQNDDWLTVVGVVRDAHRNGIERSPIPHVFEPATQALDGVTPYLIVRARAGERTLARELPTTIRALSRAAIVSGATTLEDELDQQLSPRRFQTSILGLFSLTALFLAGMGILGLIDYSVRQRTKEIGLRTALGARPADVLGLVLGEAARLTVWGTVIGIGAAMLLTRFMASLLFGVRAIDPVTFVSAPLVLILVALAASFIPAHRATRVDPVIALRHE